MCCEKNSRNFGDMAKNGILGQKLIFFWYKIYIPPSPVPTYGRSCPSILEHQDQKHLLPGPGILESQRAQRITLDQPGPVLHDPCYSWLVLCDPGGSRIPGLDRTQVGAVFEKV